MSDGLKNSYQPTLLSASVTGVVALWLLSFTGEIYGDLDETGRRHLFFALGWMLPPFAVNSVNLAILYAFRPWLSGRAVAVVNIFSAVVTFITLICATFELRKILLPKNFDANGYEFINFMLAALMSGWSLLILGLIGFGLLSRFNKEKTSEK